eukprot:CAMPEP_0174761338 /NCGR_PEP_ID=MMETSP1094-20130205/109225_1 /TAXON_ID=156173 /ORGANISM="Chrysochromulina brevifilum, Strain UTEX LB 985" /LENGTH=368 /DNA_ID=CAMNT_0015967285 /DNA_START=52 /DNA_END=1158 /DNA_ORIENTATION=+
MTAPAQCSVIDTGWCVFEPQPSVELTFLSCDASCLQASGAIVSVTTQHLLDALVVRYSRVDVVNTRTNHLWTQNTCSSGGRDDSQWVATDARQFDSHLDASTAESDAAISRLRHPALLELPAGSARWDALARCVCEYPPSPHEGGYSVWNGSTTLNLCAADADLDLSALGFTADSSSPTNASTGQSPASSVTMGGVPLPVVASTVSETRVGACTCAGGPVFSDATGTEWPEAASSPLLTETNVAIISVCVLCIGVLFALLAYRWWRHRHHSTVATSMRMANSTRGGDESVPTRHFYPVPLPIRLRSGAAAVGLRINGLTPTAQAHPLRSIGAKLTTGHEAPADVMAAFPHAPRRALCRSRQNGLHCDC